MPSRPNTRVGRLGRPTANGAGATSSLRVNLEAMEVTDAAKQ